MTRAPVSVKQYIIRSFVLLIFIVAGISGYFVFTNWKASAEKTIDIIQADIANQTVSQIDDFMEIPIKINNTNYYLIQNELVDLADKRKQEKFFANLIQSTNEDVYSVSYGTQNGEYYGARRNETGDIEVYENTAATGGKTFYYKAKPDLTAGEFVLETGTFDPRTREWYQLAQENRGPVFSPIYKHFVVNDLAVSASYPVYAKNNVLTGVMGTHLTLSGLNRRLKDIVSEHGGLAYIIERSSGDLVANSEGKPNFLALDASRIKRISIESISEREIVEAYHRHLSDQTSTMRGRRYSIMIIDYNKMGLDWAFIVAVPQSPLMAGLLNSIYFSLFLTMLLIVVSIFLYAKSIEIVLKPVSELTQTAEQFAAGAFSIRARVSRNDEIGRLSSVFNNMAEQIDLFINSLEEKIQERTLALEETNQVLELRTQELQVERDSAVKHYNELNSIHDIASKVQEEFLPDVFENSELKIKHVFKPLHKLSGDTLDFEWIPETQTLCGFIVDISGHGLIAALQATIINGVIRQVFHDRVPLNEKMNYINQASLRYFSEASYATVLYFEVDCRNMMLKVSAGGINSFWASARDQQGVVKVPGSIVGILENSTEFLERSIRIQPGDLFVFCSDGLFDLMNERDMNDLECDAVHRYLEQLCLSEARKDDASAICIEVKGANAYPQRFEISTQAELGFLRRRIHTLLDHRVADDTSKAEVAINEAINLVVLHNASTELNLRVKINLLGSLLIVRVANRAGGLNWHKILLKPEDDTEHCLRIIHWSMDKILYNKEGTEIFMTKHFAGER